MNIFFLDKDPQKAAQALCDKHVPKMLLESVQILCTVSHLHGIPAPYKPTHQKHPCTVWANSRRANYLWLLDYTENLHSVYEWRYRREHKSQSVYDWIFLDGGWPYSTGILTGMSPPAQAMPEQYRRENTIKGAVEAYRAYYIGEKARFAKWEKGQQRPDWWPI